MLAVSRITLHTIVSKNGGGGGERRAIGDVIEMSKSDSFRERDIAAVMRFWISSVEWDGLLHAYLTSSLCCVFFDEG